MLYYLFEYLEETLQLPGATLFRFLSFRAALSALLSLFIAMVFGKAIINRLRRRQIGEQIRDLGLEHTEGLDDGFGRRRAPGARAGQGSPRILRGAADRR